MTPLSDIGLRLIEARHAAGLTQRELADAVGVTQQQIARWEREGYGCVSLARLSPVADVLGIGWDASSCLAAEAASTYTPVATAMRTPSRPARDLGEVVARIRAASAELSDRFGVTRIAVFGSFARGEQQGDSDVDLIVEIEEPSLDSVFGAEERLAHILGRNVDAGTLDSLRPRVRAIAERELVDVWRA